MITAVIAIVSFLFIHNTVNEKSSPAYLNHPQNPYDTLSVPTFIGRYDDLWFIVDCYHDSIIFSPTLSSPLTDWSVMTDTISRGHSLAYDGRYYLADDTENSRVLVFERQGDSFVNTQTFENIGIRPHHIYYNQKDRSFYCWSSQSGEMYIFRRRGLLPGQSEICLHDVRSIPELADIYVRSFTIIGDDIYFVSGTGNSKIIKCRMPDFTITGEYPVPPQMAGMSQLSLINGMYYITISTDNTGNQGAATILRCRSLSDLITGDGVEDIYEFFAPGGTPYCIYSDGEDYYLLEHRVPGVSVWKFNIDKNSNNIENVELIY